LGIVAAKGELTSSSPEFYGLSAVNGSSPAWAMPGINEESKVETDSYV